MWQVKKSGGWLVRSGFILSVHTFQIVSVSLQTIKISCSTFIALISQQFIISTIPTDTLWYLCSVLLRFYWIYIILMVLSSTIKSWKWAREFYTSHILTLSSAAKLTKKCLPSNSFHSIVLNLGLHIKSGKENLKVPSKSCLWVIKWLAHVHVKVYKLQVFLACCRVQWVVSGPALSPEYNDSGTA